MIRGCYRGRVAPTGILFVDKPLGITSHDVVARARRALGTRKVGHAGTLDPAASGLLVLGIGSSTRLLTHLVGLGKRYTTTIRLGRSTTTDDADGETIADTDASGLSLERVETALAALRGEISQVPSTFSAIKVDGRRAYELARAGESVELTARTVTIDRFEVLAARRDAGFLDLDAVVDCSSGTYIRSLARDLGGALGVGGHLTALRRDRVGPFELADAVRLDDDLPAAVRSAASVASALFPTVHLDAETVVALGHGKRPPVAAPDTELAAALAPSGALVALVRIRDGVARGVVNFPTQEVLA